MAKQFRHFVKVVGRINGTGFPTDMLRYDRLTPSTEADSGKIERSIRFEREENDPIELYRLGSKLWKPQEKRWDSFVWKIVDHAVRDYI